MSDIFSKEKRSDIMSKIYSKNTSIEVMVRKWLFSLGYRYRINDKRYPGTPDIVLPKYKTAIFVHGCFWHAHTNCQYFKAPKTNIEFWTRKFERNTQRDYQKISILEEKGWNVIVVWECELKKDAIDRLIRLICEINLIDYDMQ